MNGPFIDTQLDQNWNLQGRIIPPSCSNGDGCILHLQASMANWAADHFHVGRVPLNCEAGLEFAMSLLIPVEEDMLRESLDPVEKVKDLDYLAMAKLVQPEDAIAFPTITGLTIIIHTKGIGKFFGHSDKCTHCTSSKEFSEILMPRPIQMGFDPLMQMGDEKSH